MHADGKSTLASVSKWNLGKVNYHVYFPFPFKTLIVHTHLDITVRCLQSEHVLVLTCICPELSVYAQYNKKYNLQAGQN